MPVTPKQFFDVNITAPPSGVTMERLRTATLISLAHRQEKAKAIKLEMQVIADTLCNLVQAEKAYHSKTEVFAIQNSEDPYMTSSAPEFKPSNRQVALANLTSTDPRDSVLSAPVHPVSEPTTALAVEYMRTLLDDIDKNIRLYSHKVRYYRLLLLMKQRELGIIEAERASAENKT